jgi:cobalt-zinc-cadmium efflux system outer membrane protein
MQCRGDEPERGETVKELFRRFDHSPIRRILSASILALLMLSAGIAAAEETLSLQSLIAEALANNHDILAAETKWQASTYRIGQVTALPDPMFMIGYQNEGWDKYTFGKELGAQWMYSLSQMFPFPGKRGLKGEMAARDADSSEAMYRAQRLRTVANVKELYYDLFLAYKNIDLVNDKTALFSRIEDAALARYSSGMATQQEVLMAQTEKYMLLEKETMLKQKVRSLEAMLSAALGREANVPLGKPAEPAGTPFTAGLEELQETALRQSPEILSREKMVDESQARVGMSEKEYFPDVTVAASVFQRTGPFQDMWSVTATFNIPLYFGAKRQAVAEAHSLSTGARHELVASRVMVSSSIKDNYSMLTAAEKLMGLYKDGLIPKTYQDFELALSGYVSGKVEAITVISRLKALLDFETLYWTQFVEREKAIARIEALVGTEQTVTP